MKKPSFGLWEYFSLEPPKGNFHAFFQLDCSSISKNVYERFSVARNSGSPPSQETTC